MSNAIYPKWKEAVIQASSASSLTGTLKVALMTSAYTYSASHQYLSDLAGVVGTAVALSSVTYTLGALGAANTVFPALSGSAVASIAIYIDTGTAGTSRLVAYLDTGITGVPFTPSGGDVQLTWNASGIFKI